MVPIQKLPQLELQHVLQIDVAEIFAAHTKGQLIHRSRDIKAAGAEVEQAVRRVLRRKLPSKYYVGHGHIVDVTSATSPQFDVIISDNMSAPVLWQTEDGTEYIPYEAVYAVGEVKSTFRRSERPIPEFMKKVAFLRDRLTREQTPKNYVGMGLHLGPPFELEGAIQPYRNPLFTFIIFVKSSNFSLADSDLLTLYASNSPETLPCVACFLDKGLLVNISALKHIHRVTGETKYSDINLNIIPEFGQDLPGRYSTWVWETFPRRKEYQSGAVFGYFYFMLLSHLAWCMLLPPDIYAYTKHLFEEPRVEIMDIKVPPQENPPEGA